MEQILVIEDDLELAAILCRELEAENYSVSHISSGQIALDEFKRLQPDLLILDWMLPGQDGLSVLREIRKESYIPVLMLTARSDEIDRVVGLELGADDYLTKPFSMRELLARVRALLRRVEHMRELIEADLHYDKTLVVKGICLNPQTYQAEIDGLQIDLTLTEFRLLYLFISNPGRAFTRRYLMATIWEQEYYPGDRSVDNTVLRLRKKLNNYGESIEAVRGIGYRFTI